VKRKGVAGLVLFLPALSACTSRAPHIPQAELPRAPGPEPGTLEESQTPASIERLRMPPSRAHVLDLLARFQSSISSGEPPLDEVLARTASLTAPSLETRRGSPSRSAISGALGSNFADPELIYDPFEVTVRPSETGASARVPLEAAPGGSPRRIVLSLELRYAEGSLRIDEITLSRMQ
jgi:hypothetical protein